MEFLPVRLIAFSHNSTTLSQKKFGIMFLIAYSKEWTSLRDVLVSQNSEREHIVSLPGFTKVKESSCVCVRRKVESCSVAIQRSPQRRCDQCWNLRETRAPIWKIWAGDTTALPRVRCHVSEELLKRVSEELWILLFPPNHLGFREEIDLWSPVFKANKSP